MRKTILVLAVSVLTLLTYSCKKEAKKEVEQPKKVYQLTPDNVSIHWTAYKMTEKVPVKGTFKKVVFDKVAAATPVKTINDLKFSIPVSSIFSNDSIRDYKLVNSLFGTMKDTEKINGEISLGDNGKGTASITLNGLKKDVDVTYKEKEGTIEIHTVIDLDNWQAQAAIAALNEVCLEKHTGKDGKSVTWSEVAIDVTAITVKKE